MQPLPFDCLPLFNMPFVFCTEAGICIYYPVTSCCHKRIPLLLHKLSCPPITLLSQPLSLFCIYSTRPHLRCVTFPSSVLPGSTCIPSFNKFFIPFSHFIRPLVLSSSYPPLLYSPPLCGHLCTVISTLVSFISAHVCASY